MIRREPANACSPAQQRLLDAFLAIDRFQEYLERYGEFHSMPRSAAVFAHEMKLLETEEGLSHREKERLLAKRKNTLVKEAEKEITGLFRLVQEKGLWDETIDLPEQITVSFRWPDGKGADITKALVEESGILLETGEDSGRCLALVPGSCRRVLELIAFERGPLFSTGKECLADEKDLFSVMASACFLWRIEERMQFVSDFAPRYRSMKDVPDPELRHFLENYHSRIRDERNRIYEELVVKGQTRARWVSEQEAYRIVSSHYPDARFQARPDWLHPQSLDIYIPSCQTAIEYQGKQHFEALACFGGEEAFAALQRRDVEKRKLCEKHRVRILYWNYDEPLTDAYFIEKLKPQIADEMHSTPR